METPEEQVAEIKRKKEKRDDTFSKFFLDLAKLSLTSMVLGNIVPLFNGSAMNLLNVILFVVGIITAVILTLIARRLLE
ncbi:hypothetical protein Barb6_02549 [Bacteroidales bacterium Barb6]|nr:hypothetical protein Barb6_02549 [Bacteroidales bacterium Barb6]